MSRNHSGLENLTSGMRTEDAGFISKQFSRRSLLKGAAATSAVLPAVLYPGAALDFLIAAAQELPEGAAPAEEQVYRVASDPTIARNVDFYEAVYNRPGLSDLFSEPLVRLTRNFEIIPGAAESWEGSDDGKTWTFTLKDGLMWSDGNPVTAADYVKTFQYAADPEHAWDFAWFWSGNIVNFAEAFAGEVPVEEIGVKVGASDLELIFETVDAAPYMPAKLLYSMPLSKAALETHGPYYNNSPETAVSSGPFIVSEWIQDQTLTYVKNEAYTGSMVVPFQKLIVKFATPANSYTMYEAGEIDFMEGPAPAELQLAQASIPDEIYQGVGDFACYYFFFDVTSEPWTDIKVRQAFAHVVDRDAMKAQIWTDQANPAPSFLAPGFPASNTDALADIQTFDPELAKSLLAEAGYPNGEGFPKLTITQRGGAAPIEVSTIQAYASMLKQHLNIDAEIQSIDRQAFYDDMKSIHIGFVSYGMDYFDASNMLGVWLTGGRHPWTNADFDAKVKEATIFLGDEAERTTMFQDAERILVEDVPAAFTFFMTPIQLLKPYVTGPALEADDNGITAIHWPGYGSASTVPEELYISSDAPSGRS